jgi:hypothetical protein
MIRAFLGKAMSRLLEWDLIESERQLGPRCMDCRMNQHCGGREGRLALLGKVHCGEMDLKGNKSPDPVQASFLSVARSRSFVLPAFPRNLCLTDRT